MTGFGVFLVSRRRAYAKYSTFSKTETKTLNFHFFCLCPTHSIAFLCTLTAPVCSLPELPLISDSLYSSFHMVYWRCCWSAGVTRSSPSMTINRDEIIMQMRRVSRKSLRRPRKRYQSSGIRHKNVSPLKCANQCTPKQSLNA